jgi:hypothetical protein
MEWFKLLILKCLDAWCHLGIMSDKLNICYEWFNELFPLIFGYYKAFYTISQTRR